MLVLKLLLSLVAGQIFFTYTYIRAHIDISTQTIHTQEAHIPMLEPDMSLQCIAIKLQSITTHDRLTFEYKTCLFRCFNIDSIL